AHLTLTSRKRLHDKSLPKCRAYLSMTWTVRVIRLISQPADSTRIAAGSLTFAGTTLLQIPTCTVIPPVTSACRWKLSNAYNSYGVPVHCNTAHSLAGC